MPPPSWEVRYQRCEKQRRFAWAKYYELANEEHGRDYAHYNVIRQVITADLDDFVKKQLIEMGDELKKAWECPICLEFIAKDNLDITPCGHYYCRGCLLTLKKTAEPKCAMCRRGLKHED